MFVLEIIRISRGVAPIQGQPRHVGGREDIFIGVVSCMRRPEAGLGPVCPNEEVSHGAPSTRLADGLYDMVARMCRLGNGKCDDEAASRASGDEGHQPHIEID